MCFRTTFSESSMRDSARFSAVKRVLAIVFCIVSWILSGISSVLMPIARLMRACFRSW